MASLTRRLAAEALGTFSFVFIGCASVTAAGIIGGDGGVLGVAFAHALALSVMITATMNISGGHLNPAVTLSLLSVRRIDAKSALLYIVAQLGGASLGALLVKLLYGHNFTHPITLGTPSLGSTMTWGTAIGIEAVLTFFLVSAVFGTVVSPDAPKVGGFGVGMVLLFDIIAGGALTGAVMNPARAFGPALISGTWYAQPVWWIGPILGGFVAAQIWERVLLKKD